MEPYTINVKEQGASAKISKNKRRKLERYSGIKTSEPRPDYGSQKELKAGVRFFSRAFGNTDYIWRKLEQNAMLHRGRRKI